MSVVQACPRCGAAVRLGASWCSLCLEPVDRPSAAPGSRAASPGPVAAPPAPVAAEPDAPLDPLTAPLEQLEGRAAPVLAAAPQDVPASLGDLGWSSVAPEAGPVPADDEGAPDPTDLDLDTMFVLLAAEHRSTDPLSGLAARMGERSTRTLVIGGGMVGLSLLLVGVLALLSVFG